MTKLEAEIKNAQKQAQTVEIKRQAFHEASNELEDAQQHLYATIDRIAEAQDV